MKKLSPFILLAALSLPTSLWAQTNEAPASPVRVSQVRETSVIPTVDIVGTIYSRHNVKLTAGVAGRLQWVAEPGTFIIEAQTVARVDPLPLKLQLAEQTAQIRRQNINIHYLQRETKRLTDLRKTDSTSAFQLDQTRSQFEMAQADLEIAELKQQQIADQLSRTEVKAPFTGVITERIREAGADVNRSQILVHMLDTENLQGRIFVPVKYLPFISKDKGIVIKTENQAVTAQVQAIIPSADTRSQSFELRVNLPEDVASIWTAGQFIRAELPVREASVQLSVPRDALILRREGTFIVKIDNDNKAHRLPVKVGKGHKEWVSIEGDIEAGDKVATRGAERLTEGQTVTVNIPKV